MHETMEKVKRISCLKDKLVGMLENCQYDLDSEFGEKIVDEIKDLADAEKSCWEACYYKKMIESLDEYSEMNYEDGRSNRMGYDHWRYSDGKFAPAGRGTYSAGYSDSSKRGNVSMSSSSGSNYDGYARSRKNYTQSHSASDKADMDRYAMNHVMSTVSSAKEIWEDADPALKSQMKNEFADLASMMGI